jgi:DNA-binding LytR/AlgR family response regulator
MRVTVRKIKDKEQEQVVIECVDLTQEIKDIYSYALSKGVELPGVEDGHMAKIKLEDIYYFEAVDEKLFAYTQNKVFEIKLRLYEAERAYAPYHFIRCSKSVVLNLMQLKSISPALNGRFLAHLKSGEKVMISRQYISSIREKVFGGNKNEI